MKDLTADEKSEIAARCARLIEDSLKPRFLPAIRPDAYNYPVDITGRWHGRHYRFAVRFRSGFDATEGQEFDAPFARLDHLPEHCEEPRFDVMWFRHTGTWWRLHAAVTLEAALHLLDTDGVLAPPI